MKLFRLIAFALSLMSGVACQDARAGPRSSLDYAIPAETLNAGGLRATSADYIIDGSLDAFGGISFAAPEATASITAQGRPKLHVTGDQNRLVITWTGGGTLEVAVQPGGPYLSTGNVSGTFIASPGAVSQFYRVKR
jgi:hypothetical protein